MNEKKIYLNIIIFGHQQLMKKILLTRGLSISMMAMTFGAIRHTIIMPYVFVSERDSIFDFCKEKENIGMM